MRDGRAVYIGAERVDDVTTHPAFRAGAQTIAALYDLKANPAKRDQFSYEENGEHYALQWLRCRTREELTRLITGLAMKPSVLESLHPGFGENLIRYYERARRDDLYLCFAVVPPTGLRSRELFPGQERDDPSLQVVAENDSGVVVSGMKMLATG